MGRILAILACGLWLTTAAALSVAGGGCAGGPDEAFIKATPPSGTSDATKTTPSGTETGDAEIVPEANPPPEEPPSEAPTAFDLTLHYPLVDQTNVDVNTALVLNFTKAVDKNSLNAAFQLAPYGGGPAVGFTVQPYVGPDGEVPTAVAIMPSSPLASNTVHTATVSTDAKDIDGVFMAANYSWSFKTAEETGGSSGTTGGGVGGYLAQVGNINVVLQDLIPPEIDKGIFGVNSQSFLIAFTEPVNYQAMLDNDSVQLYALPIGIPIRQTGELLKDSDRIFKFIPDKNFTNYPGSTYWVKILGSDFSDPTKAVVDLAGNKMTTTYGSELKCGAMGKGTVPCDEPPDS